MHLSCPHENLRSLFEVYFGRRALHAQLYVCVCTQVCEIVHMCVVH